MILSWLPVIKNGKFCTFSHVLYTAVSPSPLMKLLLEFHRQCCCCYCSLHNNMQPWAKVVIKCTSKFEPKMKRKTNFFTLLLGFFPRGFFFFFLSNWVAFILSILCPMQLFAWGYTEWMRMSEAPGNAFLQGFHYSRWWKKLKNVSNVIASGLSTVK